LDTPFPLQFELLVRRIVLKVQPRLLCADGVSLEGRQGSCTEGGLGMNLEKVGGRFSYSGSSHAQKLLPVLLEGHFLVNILKYIRKLLPVIPTVQ